MVTKRMLLFAALLFVSAACSSREQSGGVLPRAGMESQALAVNPATACVIVPGTASPFTGWLGAASTTDAWDATGGGNAQIEHFTGASWHAVQQPTIPNRGSYQLIVPDGVRAISVNDVWISVEGDSSDDTTTAFFFHWNGSALTYVPNAPTLTHPYRILSMAGTASNNVWALAESAPSPSFASQSVQLERWDGARWSLVASYSNGNGIFSGVLQVFGTNDVWVGLQLPTSIAVVHWNGSTFTTTPIAPLYLNGQVPSGFTSFSGTADNDIWMAANNLSAPYIARHASVWATYNTSLVAGYELVDIVDFKPGYVLLTAKDPHGNLALLVYNGSVRWRPTTSPFPSGFDGIFQAVAVKGTTSFWAGYYSSDPAGPQGADVLIRCPPIPPAPL